jgi:signal transduction histidine kinase
MITSLRRRVFWSILLSAAGVLLAILLAINVLRLAQTASKRESILDSAMRMLPPEFGMERGRGNARGGGRDRSELLRSVSEDELGVLALGADGSVIAWFGCADQLDEETVSSIAAAAFADKNGHGRVDGWEYKAVRNGSGYDVSFLDAASLRRENWETALLSLAAFTMSCCLFALMARLLARVIVRPVEENMQMQKRFVADASHELKTPLTVIDANASVLEQSIGQNKWLGYIREQTERMSGLVNELLQLSNLEEAKGTDVPQPRERYDAAEAIMTAALPFESVAFERGVALETDAPEALDAQGNRKDLEQLTAILIDNAVKHSAPGGTVRVSLIRSAQRHGWRENPMLELRVSNSGEGIPPEALPHIFDRFYRVDESRAHRDNSYGLGLAIAKGLAEKNHGSITATSQNGFTEFTLLLPTE